MPEQAFIDSLPSPYREVPPLREDPFAPDSYDQRRIDFVRGRWHAQDDLLRPRDRQIEENVRMLAGQQWSVYSELLGRFVDVSRYMSDDERRWRHLPVLNRLLYWFMLIHARMTENPPVMTYQPATLDRIDAKLAEVADPIIKALANEAGLLEVLDDMFAWLVPGGRAFLKSRIDPNGGAIRELRGPAVLSLLDGNGSPIVGLDGQPIQRYADDVPFDEKGNPLATLYDDGTFEPSGAPAVLHEGALVVDVLCALEARGTWGPTPWHRKPWHIHKTFLTPEELFEATGVEVEPDVRGDDADDVGFLRRLLQGAGWFGSVNDQRKMDGTSGEEADGYVSVYEMWERPKRYPGMQETAESPGGRLTIVTPKKVIRDGVRFARFAYTSPIRAFDFVKLPGRPSGTTPQEMLNGPQRTLNRVSAQVINHATLAANPITLIDETQIPEGQITNAPAQQVRVRRNGSNVPPVDYVRAPDVGQSAYNTIDMLRESMDELGNIAGAEGAPPTADASGELVKELRFNSDRFIGPTMRRAVIEIARMQEDWFVLLPIMWDEEKVIRAAGDDQAATSVTVLPELLEQGKLNIVPEVESMLPEGRGERQGRIWAMYRESMFGPPGSPQAVAQAMDLLRFPHMGRAVRPGGVHRVLAEQENAKLAMGTPAAAIPVLEVYDHAVHLEVLETFMASPEFLRLDRAKQAQFWIHREQHQGAAMMVAMRQAELAATAEGGARRAAVAAAPELAPELIPPPPDKGATADTPALRAG